MTNLAAAGSRGGSITVGGQIVSQIVRTLGLIVLARLIAPDIFGLVAIVSTINVFATSIIYLGIGMASAQAVSLSNEAKSSMFYLNTVTGLALAIALFFLADPIATLYGHPTLVPIVQWLSLIPLLSGIQAQFRINLVRNLRFVAVSASEVISQSVATGFAIALAIMGFTYEAIVVQVLTQVLVQLIVIVFFARWLPGMAGNWRGEVRELLAVGLRIFGMNALKNLSRSVVIPVLGLVSPASVVGNFDRAQQLVVIPINLTVDQLQRVAVPILSRLRGQSERTLAYLLRAQLLATYGTATGFLVVSALAQPLVLAVLGPNWTIAGDLLQILAIGAIFRALGQAMQWIFISAGETAAGLRFSAWSQPAVVALTLAGLPWGVVGITIASTVAWALYWPIATIIATRSANLATAPLLAQPLRIILSFSLPVAVAAFLARLLPLAEWPMLLVGAGFALACALLLFAVVPVVRRDIALLLATLKLGLIRQELERD